MVGRWAGLSRIGKEIFGALGGFGLFYALLAGPLSSVDCISRERREGTLGLLFLTNLHSYDIVLGKIAAASFDLVLGLVAALPVLSLPLLMGGVTLVQFARLVLALADVIFLSLAIGVCVSSIFRSGRAAVATALVLLFALTFGLTFLGEAILHVPQTGPAPAFFYMFCPFYTFELCLGVPMREPTWKYWLNLGGLQALAWGCLIIACFRTSRVWRDLPASNLARRWQALFARLRQGRSRARLAWRSMLERNPIHWLEGRDRLQERILWALFLLITIGFALKRLYSEDWPRDDFVVLWSWWAQCVICLWIAFQAPRRLADDKQSGALELILCTPLATRDIIRGNMQAFQRRYGRVFIGLMALDVFLLFAHFSHDGGWRAYREGDLFKMSLMALSVCPLQAYSFARVGLYQGLVQANSVRASFVAIWKVGLLPWILFLLFVLGCDMASRQFKTVRLTETIAFSGWAACHVLPCLFFLAHANWLLKHKFRVLALSCARRSWWKLIARW